VLCVRDMAAKMCARHAADEHSPRAIFCRWAGRGGAGMLMSRVPEEWIQAFKTPLPLKRLGFSKVAQLLGAMPQLKVVTNGPSCMVYLASAETGDGVAGGQAAAAGQGAMLWACDAVVRSEAADRAMRSIVLRPEEFGRGRDLPADRLAEIDAACAEHAMTRYQALSLRRQLIRAEHGMQRVNQSPLMGDAHGQQTYAHLFERAVEKYLRQHDVHFVSEQQQKAEMERGIRGRGPTPDFLFPTPATINDKKVYWLDCKVFYGTSLLAGNKKLPVGRLPDIARKYSVLFGPGGFVFGQSFNTHLQTLLGHSVTLLDASPLDLSEMEEWQDQQA